MGHSAETHSYELPALINLKFFREKILIDLENKKFKKVWHHGNKRRYSYFYAASAEAWRDWLIQNHQSENLFGSLSIKKRARYPACITLRPWMKRFDSGGSTVKPTNATMKAITSFLLNETRKATGVG